MCIHIWEFPISHYLREKRLFKKTKDRVEMWGIPACIYSTTAIVFKERGWAVVLSWNLRCCEHLQISFRFSPATPTGTQSELSPPVLPSHEQDAGPWWHGAILLQCPAWPHRGAKVPLSTSGNLFYCTAVKPTLSSVSLKKGDRNLTFCCAITFAYL